MKQFVKTIHRINYCVYFIFHYFFDSKFYVLRRIIIKNNVETVNYIIRHKVSVSRFGDGELGLISNCNTDFQRYNPAISKKLREVLNVTMPNHIVCIPHPWKNFWTLKYEAFEYWSSYLTKNLDMKILPYISPNKIYYDASFTRFYIDYKNDNNAKRIIPLIKRIWDERDIYIIEGELTRLGMGNNLLDNAKSIHRIIAPPLNAFEKYDEIMAAVKGYAPKSVLILIALGMTATCLAYDLSKEGYQAIDIGHVDIEYEWFLMRSPKRVAIKNKYVSESNERFISDGIKDELYNSQIVARVL